MSTAAGWLSSSVRILFQKRRNTNLQSSTEAESGGNENSLRRIFFRASKWALKPCTGPTIYGHGEDFTISVSVGNRIIGTLNPLTLFTLKDFVFTCVYFIHKIFIQAHLILLHFSDIGFFGGVILWHAGS